MDLMKSISWIYVSHLRSIKNDDTLTDRLSHRYTVAMCTIFAILVSVKQYIGDPIDCLVPTQFKLSYEKYTDSYCWITGSWYTPMDKELPLSSNERKQSKIRYYQWVPFFLLLQSLMCYIPRIIWRCLNTRSGLNITNLLDASLKFDHVDKFAEREKIMNYIIRSIERFIKSRNHNDPMLNVLNVKKFYEDPKNIEAIVLTEKSNSYLKKSSKDVNKIKNLMYTLQITMKSVCFCIGKPFGNYLVVLYMIVKSLWLTNAISQLFLLNHFIGNNYYAFGLEIIKGLINGNEWNEMKHFPRITYCDFKIREIGNNHDFTVQCILRINLFNEVIYIFMWFWLCLLVLCNIIDYCHFAFCCLRSQKRKFIKDHIDINIDDKGDMFFQINSYQVKDVEFYEKDINGLIDKFVFSYLKNDGIFAMRILAANSSDLTVSEIISKLFHNFISSKQQFNTKRPIEKSKKCQFCISNNSRVISDDIKNIGEINLNSQTNEVTVNGENLINYGNKHFFKYEDRYL